MQIIDSHVHLWSENELKLSRWNNPQSPLWGGRRLEEYEADANGLVDALVYVETDVKTEPETGQQGWNYAIREFEYLISVLTSPLGASKLKAIVVWAPISDGPKAVADYVAALRRLNLGVVDTHLRGFRYIVQDKPRGTMTAPAFIESVQWLGKHGFSFDLTIDVKSQGLWQLEEAIELVSSAPHTTFVVNHLTKPDIDPAIDHPTSTFGQWQQLISTLAANPNTVVKLSGAFSELPPNWDPESASDLVLPFFKTCLDNWGSNRILWGSDWPVCTVPRQGGFKIWARVTNELLEKAGMSKEDKDKVFSVNSRRVYRINL